jgi:hypothetical protein
MTVAWVDRVRTALEPTGYYHDNKFRKSLQTAVLFEALRSVNASSAQNHLKSYERKYALLQQADILLDELVQGRVMTPPQRDEVLWKTASSRQTLDAPTAWKRVKAIERELNALALQVRPFLTFAAENGEDPTAAASVPSSHDDAVDQMVRAQYVRIGRRSCGYCYGRSGSCCLRCCGVDPSPSHTRALSFFSSPLTLLRPQEANPTDYVKAYRDVIGTREWELTHNHLLFTFRLYFRGDQLDPHFPPPNDLAALSADVVQSHRNRAGNASSRGRKSSRQRGDAGGGDRHGTNDVDDDDEDDGDEEEEAGTAAAHAVAHAINGGTSLLPASGTDAAASAAARRETATIGSADVSAADSAPAADPEADERRRLLREVKDHLEILKEFEGIVPADELAQRKRALFLALPPAPPPPALLPPLSVQQHQHSGSSQRSSSGQHREQPSIDLNGAKRSRT